MHTINKQADELRIWMQHGFALKAIIKKTIHMTYRDIQYMCACTDKTVSPEYEFNIKHFPLEKHSK